MSKTISITPDANVRPRGFRGGLLGVFVALAFALLALPAAASAADRWVDAETGSDTANDCDVQASPCATISQAVDMGGSAIDEVIHVDDGVYETTASINIGGQKTLIADNFVPSDSGATRIVKSGPGTALHPSADATVEGFEISGPEASAVVVASDNTHFEDNKVTATAPNSTALLVFDDAPTVIDNEIVAESGDEDIGIQLYGGTTGAIVRGNEIGGGTDAFFTGIRMHTGPDAAATIENNTILGTRQDGGLRGRGIVLNGVHDVSLTENVVTSPGSGTSHGLDINSLDAGDSVVLRRNQFVGMDDTGVLITDSAGPISFEGDLIAAGGADAIYAGNVEALSFVNATIYGNAEPSRFGNAEVAIDSSILGEQINSDDGSACEISFSRGATTTPGGDGCDAFQTDADPGFISTDPGSLDLHLTAGSPLVDAGNPADPAAAIDIDGDDRALEGDGECPIDPERDMGYDEVVTDVPDCPVTEPPPGGNPPPAGGKDTTAPETKVKGPKKQSGKRGRFTLVSTEADSTFECRIDRGEFAPCKAELRTRRLNRGRHTLFVRATDAAGNTDRSPFAKKFKLTRKKR